MERFKTILLMISLMLLFMWLGYAIAGEQGMMIAFISATAMNFISYFFSDKIVLRHYKAVPVSENDARGLYDIVRRLSQKAALPMPKVYIIPDQAPNAFATGRNPQNAVIAATEGLLNLMTPEEIEGVLAHEMSHIRHYDILIGTVAAVFAGAIAMLANFAQFSAMYSSQDNRRSNGVIIILAAIIMPIAASVIQMAISRTREYKADEGAANLTGHPEWLASALSKLDSYAKNYKMQRATPQSAHMFIINPLGGLGSKFANLFSTHPSTTDRIARLNEIKRQMQR